MRKKGGIVLERGLYYILAQKGRQIGIIGIDSRKTEDILILYADDHEIKIKLKGAADAGRR
jgi:hypothetical protein